jgi:hypothetical protein
MAATEPRGPKNTITIITIMVSKSILFILFTGHM